MSHSSAGNAASVVRSSLDFPVVGIGASAGGLEATTGLLKATQAMPGMAFVVVLHLSPDQRSSAAELLQHATSMPVVMVTKATPIEMNHVYVIPPNRQLSMNDGYLKLTEFDRPVGARAAIDIFFRTLADTHGDKAFAIVLSGAGSDGAVGITRIKEQGGVTLVQYPGEAAHDSMPLAAITTGTVDFILPVKEMPQKLADLWANAQAIALPSIEDREDVLHGDPAESGDDAEASLQKIISLLRLHTGHDFRHYKRPTVLRRIERRLQVRGASTLPAYLSILESDASEHGALLRDMLIGVTNFFRDRESFEALENTVLSELVRAKHPGEPIRAWVPACSTGEEAYSIAMALADQAALVNKPPKIQVFASDIDERAISTARSALYPGSIIADVSPERLQQYFSKEEDRYRIRKSIRDLVLFAPHNVLRDPPFSKLDLISCRNLLIYLNREMQTHILEMFHFSLNPGGYLFLGSSESADLTSNIFTPVDKKNRIYQAKSLSRGRFAPSLPGYATTRHQHLDVSPVPAKRQFSFAEVHQRVLAQYAPPSAIVNHESDIVYMSDRVGRFLRHVGGEPSRNLVSLVHPELRVELRTALFQAVRSGKSVEARRVRLNRDGRLYFVNMTVRPFRDDDAGADLVLVLFDEVEQTMSDEAQSEGEKKDAVLTQLEEELQRTKEQLQETIEQSEVSNEELRASNEELQAINEELRSATEELETSKEELQSVNEELSTVNYELKSKVEETGKVNDDLNNLIASADIATIFVDRGMRIKRYTPRASDIFNIIPTDIGRSLLDITHRLNYPELAQDASDTFDTLRPVEREVRSLDGRYYIARLLPYRTTEDHIEGAVMTFFDITSRREAEEQFRAGEERMRLVAESMKDYGIVTLDADGHITSWSRGAELIFGYTESEVTGLRGDIMLLPEDRASGIFESEMRRARDEGRVEDQRWVARKDGGRLFASGVMVPLKEGSREGFAKIMRDETDRVEMESRREAALSSEHSGRTSAENASAMKDEFLAIMSHELRNPLNLIHMNVELLARLADVQQSPMGIKALNNIRAAVANQSKVIEDVLDLSRIQTGKLALSLSTVDFSALVQDLGGACKDDPAAHDRNIDVTIADAQLLVHADRVRLDQVVLNLLNNAVKFTRPGGRISIRLGKSGRSAVLEVIDDGKGISPDFLPHVFDMFRQGEGGASRSNGGLGIGLALARHIVELHNGTIEASSGGPDRGCLFRVSLPLRGQPQDDGAVRPDHHRKALENLRLLLVDDNAAAVESFRYLLELEGAEVSVAHSAEEALEMLAGKQLDLIISDLAMPHIDGFSFMTEVKKRHPDSAVAAIALSGLGRPQDAERAMSAGFSAHLTKPVTIERLRETVAHLMQSRQNCN
ncbi:chemotaxis protein [Noviherbaspirillum denitrificans]|uniref:Chemotaxis protein n=2 Tax=Noviherbaspirillum denitrificans TaxID=1968433 RepID=A0A254TK58_9BURK|nr:CheR family methyltransferase [Noviherbaspirillum denitrificans]OWW22954.1 chemotaxis protein [Noviherbaspirillum denitrificans]